MRRTLGFVLRPRVAIPLLLVAVLVAGALMIRSHRRTAELLRQGEEALAARDYTKGRDYLERYLEIRPGDVRARLLAARCARRLRLYDEARDHLQRCRKDRGDVEAIDIEDALIDVQQGDARPVAGLRDRAQKEDELSLVILEALIQYDLDTYQLRQALHGLTQYLKQRPDDLQALLGRGYVWEKFLYFKDAVQDYRKAMTAHPENERARLRLADTLLIAGTPAEALAHYQWLAERRPQQPEVRLGLARCRRRLGQGEEARKLLDGLLAEPPDKGEVLWERGELALDEGKPSEAETWLRRAVRLLPFDRRVHYALYRCLLELKHPDAEAINTRVSQLDADVLKLEKLRQEVMKRPGDADLRLQGGLLFLRNGERNEGIRWLQIALRLKPDCEEARKALADADAPLP